MGEGKFTPLTKSMFFNRLSPNTRDYVDNICQNTKFDGDLQGTRPTFLHMAKLPPVLSAIRIGVLNMLLLPATRSMDAVILCTHHAEHGRVHKGRVHC